MTQTEILMKALKLIWELGVCPETKPNEWVKILWHMHNKGWLFVHVENDEVDVVVGAYRIREFDESKVDILPYIEEGDILYIPFLVSRSKDIMTVRRMLNKYMEEYPIKEIIFYEWDENEKLKRYKRIGGLNGKTENPELTATADVSS